MSPSRLGGQLFRSLFSGQINDLLLQSLSLVGPRRGLRIRLRINPRGVGLERLHGLPWELLFREDTDDFLALSRRTPIVRSLDIARPVPEQPFLPPLRILAVVSQLPGTEQLALAEELQELRRALHQTAGIVLEILENPDARALRAALDAAPFQVLHYMGHGTFDEHSGEGALLLRKPGGEREVLSGRNLSTKIKDVSSLRLVVLNACQTAVTSGSPGHNPFAGVAAALLLGGVPAVVAMQSAVEDRHAVTFSAAFYKQLARGAPVEEAVTEGRQAIHDLEPDGSSWAIPVLLLRTPTGILFPPSEQLRPQRAHAIAVASGALLLLSVLVFLPTLLNRREPQPATLVPAGERAAATSTPIPTPPQTSSQKPDRPSETPPSAPAPIRAAGAVRTLRLGEGNDRFLVEIVGSRSFPVAFDEAFLGLARRFPASGVAGWRLRVDGSAPEVDPPDEDGFRSCRLSVSSRLQIRTQVHELGSIEIPRAQLSASSACNMAAADLAKSVIHKMTPYVYEEGSP
ncbi:MAG TPA: CHAT domain-containing protein [Thermoanaerobaculia bacterium]|nr:CHAT domain-containing protein [Thermoanaerobaculia bacterium]